MDCLSTIAAVGLHLGSMHFPQENFNNFNPGAYVRSECEVLYGQPQIGTFYNSENAMSFYGALEFEYDREAVLTPFLLVGAVTGYDTYPVVPLISAGGRLLLGDVGIALGYSPPFGDLGAHVVHLAVEFRF